MDALYGHATEPILHQVSRVRRPNVAWELAGARLERLRSKKKARAGFASNVTVKIREITELLTDDRNLSTVKENLVHAVIAFDRLKEAHFDYWSEVKDASGIAECRDYWVRQNENFRAFCQQVDDWMALAEHRVLQASLRGGSDLLISPEDSVSCIGSHAQSSSSKRSKNHSRVSSRSSLAAPEEAVRMKEAAKFAEFKAEKFMLEKRQVLEEKKFRLKQEEARLNLEVEIAKSAAKEHALAALSPSPSDNLPLRPLESKPEVKKESTGLPLHMNRRRWRALVKPEDCSALSKFAIFLTSCKNALGSSLYASKFDQAGNLQKLVFKLPFSMRERWRHSANDIMDLQSRRCKV